ncbi:MAG TPA: hypothetical protein VJT72_15520 [Pseudonocardiaceae bacterium]|nr:hypothetical protein [Pseudonocardiaceae bacterium]
MTASARRHDTRHYPTGDPATPGRAAFNVGVMLGSWQVAAPLVEALASQVHALVVETIETYDAERIVVTAVLDTDRAAVHVLSVACLQDHSNDLIDPATAGVLQEAAERWGATGQQPCLCTTFALLGDDWKSRRLFIAPRPLDPQVRASPVADLRCAPPTPPALGGALPAPQLRARGVVDQPQVRPWQLACTPLGRERWSG